MAASFIRSSSLKLKSCCLSTGTKHGLQSLGVIFQQNRNGSSNSIQRERGTGRYLKPFLREMYKKRLEIGPEKPRRRSEWINWNYDCELFSFGKRLGEEFNDATLRKAFIHRSYIEEEKKKRAELGIDTETVSLDMEDNSELAKKGEAFISSYLKVYLRNVYPYMFEECISSVHDYLMTEEMLSYIASHIGCEELILSQEFPVDRATLSDTFKAVVGALVEDQGREQAEAFVRDFVVVQLVGKDINELCTLVNPMGLLVALLSLTGRGEPEPRLLWSSGSSSVLSLYWVGIYSNQQLLAKAPGESLPIAEEMAAREAVKKIMRTEDNRAPMVLGEHAKNIQWDYDRVNASIEDILKQYYSSTQQQNDKLSG